MPVYGVQITGMISAPNETMAAFDFVRLLATEGGDVVVVAAGHPVEARHVVVNYPIGEFAVRIGLREGGEPVFDYDQAWDLVNSALGEGLPDEWFDEDSGDEGICITGYHLVRPPRVD